MQRISEFMVWLSGQKPEVLARVPSERRKAVALGGTVATTSVAAAVSMAYAVGTYIGLGQGPAAAVGLAWGAAILNIDRFILASMRRQEGVLANVLAMLPRLAIAALFGLVIGEPLVLRAFDGEVKAAANIAKEQALADRRQAIEKEYAPIGRLRKEAGELVAQLNGQDDQVSAGDDAELGELTVRLADLRTELAHAELAVICEKEGTCGSGKVGEGVAARERIELRDGLRRQVAAAEKAVADRTALLKRKAAQADRDAESERRARLLEVRTEADQLEAQRKRAKEQFDRAMDRPPGLSDRMEALSGLGKEKGSVATAAWVLRLFILALDAGPTLYKGMLLLGRPSLYDSEADAYEDEVAQRNRMRWDAERKAHEIELSVVVDAAQAQRDVQLQAEKDIATAAARAQVHVAQIQIDDWKAAQVSQGPTIVL